MNLKQKNEKNLKNKPNKYKTGEKTSETEKKKKILYLFLFYNSNIMT